MKAKPMHPPMTPAKRKTFAEDLLNSKTTAELKMGIASILKEETDASKILTLAYQLEEQVNDSEPVKQLLRKAIADAGKRDSKAPASTLIAPAKSAKTAPLPLTGESTGPDWSRARAMLSGIKTMVRMTLAAQVMLGLELQTLKVELGFCGSGRRKERPNDSVFKSLNRTWEQWCKAELGISPDGADNFISLYEAAKLRIKKHGGQPKLLSLVETHPSKFTKQDSDLLSGMVDKLCFGETQKSLLEELRIYKRSETTTGGNTSTGKKKGELPVEQLAFAFFSKAAVTVTKLEKDVSNLLVSPDYQGYLHSLPLHRSGPDGLSLHSLKITLESALKGDLQKMLADVEAAIAAAETKDAA